MGPRPCSVRLRIEVIRVDVAAERFGEVGVTGIVDRDQALRIGRGARARIASASDRGVANVDVTHPLRETWLMSIAVGIDVAEARKGLDLVALDQSRRVIESLRRATVNDVADAIVRLTPAVVCIDSPPAWALSGPTRVAERQLRRFGITAFSTPTDPGAHAFYRWMRVGFAIYAAIADSYPLFRGGSVQGTAVEVFPEASAVLLAQRLRPADEPKAQFRRSVLEQNGIDCSMLVTVDALDAALAALTGVMALNGSFTAVGDPAEGVIVLPVADLPNAPLIRAPGAAPAGRDGTDELNVARPAEEEQPCLCGCGALVRRRFLPGHDAKLKSRLLRLRAEGCAATERLRKLGWLGDDAP